MQPFFEVSAKPAADKSVKIRRRSYGEVRRAGMCRNLALNTSQRTLAVSPDLVVRPSPKHSHGHSEARTRETVLRFAIEAVTAMCPSMPQNAAALKGPFYC